MKYCEKDGEDIIMSSLDINQVRYMMQQQAYGPMGPQSPSWTDPSLVPHQMLPQLYILLTLSYWRSFSLVRQNRKSVVQTDREC